MSSTEWPFDEHLKVLLGEQQAEYENYIKFKRVLDMSRGKPSTRQLNFINKILDMPNYIMRDGRDARNYGIVDGVPEVKELFAELLGIPTGEIILGGNSSLNMMYDTISRLMLFGTQGNEPWAKQGKIKFLCPSPGYDRHFAICEEMGIEMITIPMRRDGPDMNFIEELVGMDESIKGIWCVPLYSNPQGICYSDEVVDRLAKMKTKANDFRIFWDNAYGIHHIYNERKLKDIRKAAEDAGNEDRILYFFSTSKITLPGAGVALMALSPRNYAEAIKHIQVQTIGPNKIEQLRTLQFFKNVDGIHAHMKKLGNELRKKFNVVLNTLDKEIGNSDLKDCISWTRPDGGYFISLETMPGCARETVALAKVAGLILTPAGVTFPYGIDSKDSNIRIAPSYPSIEELQEAINLLCVCIKIVGYKRLLEI
jgi:aspartate/methionine/tyrosine aminotransferase